MKPDMERPAIPSARPVSDVSPTVGLLGIAGLFAWVLICRNWPELAATAGLEGPHERFSGPAAALIALIVTALPMVLYSVFVERVHLRPSTGLDWSEGARRRFDWSRIALKVGALWATFAIIALFYWLARWYWSGGYGFAIGVLATLIVPIAIFTIPYIALVDRAMIEPRDATWHFGAFLTGLPGWKREQVEKHARTWIIKGFFTAFMISILPFGFREVVLADFGEVASDPVLLGGLLIAGLFLIDVQIGTVGYILTMRPLDAHIRSGNPFLSGWVAALICYPPFVWGIIGNGLVLNYETDTAGWSYWFAGSGVLAWGWMAWLVLLTAVYAWATAVFGIRFSNLTYRGVITHGPYRWTRHPAYVSKNLFWWSSVLPFLVTSGSTGDAIRNTFCLLCVNAIYYWRARTEEAHLLAEDPKYAEYHAWMGQHGLITAPLARTQAALASRWRADSQPSGSPSSVS